LIKILINISSVSRFYDFFHINFFILAISCILIISLLFEHIAKYHFFNPRFDNSCNVTNF